MTDEETHMVECAKINLDNLAKLVPGLADHPMFKIVQEQLKWATDGTDETT